MINIKLTSDADRVMRYNGYPSADITGVTASGYSSGQATDAIEKIVKENLHEGMAYEWTDLTLAVFFAFLILAAQYNSWSLPFAVLLIAPMALLSAIGGIWI